MTKSRKVADYIDKELPYQLLMRLNDNSRLSLRRLGKELGISYHVIARKLKELEDKYKLFYTLDIDTDKLGFAEGRLVTIKFEKMPDIDFLKGLFANDLFVQDAYLAQGDFDLLLYVVGLTQNDFQIWQFNLRTKLHDYAPKIKFSTVNAIVHGFFPIRNEILEKAELLSKTEKKILSILNENSRMKLSDIVKKAHTSQMRAIYIIKKLRQLGIIKKFSILVQNPNKMIFGAFGLYLYPIADHARLTIGFKKALVDENLHEGANDYSIIANTNGAYDTFYICAFDNGEHFSKKGPNLLKTLWADEKPEAESAILIDLLVGKWPFMLNRYKFAEKDFKEINENKN